MSTFQLIAYWHTSDSKYLCSSRESLIQLSTWSHQPALWFQHLRISKRGNMQMPKSPRENSSGEAVIGGRERSSNERYYHSLEMKEIGVGEGRKWRIWRLEMLTPYRTGCGVFREQIGWATNTLWQYFAGSACLRSHRNGTIIREATPSLSQINSALLLADKLLPLESLLSVFYNIAKWLG